MARQTFRKNLWLLTVTPHANSEFIGWSGALEGTTSPITLTMKCHSEMACDKAVTASFDESEFFIW